MSTMLNALVLIFELIVLGYAFKRARMFPDILWDGIELLLYWLLPALLIIKLANTNLSEFEVPPMSASMVGATLLIVFIPVGRPSYGTHIWLDSYLRIARRGQPKLI